MVELAFDQLGRLEAALNEVAYRGLPIGSTLSDILISEVFAQRRDLHRMHWRLGMLVERFHRFAGAYVEVKSLRSSSARCDYLVSWTGFSRRFSDLILPVLKRLDAGHTVVSVVVSNQVEQLPSAMGVLLNDTGRFRPSKRWAHEYDAKREAWIEVLRGFKRERLLDAASVARLLDGVCFQSQRIEVWGRILKDLSPRVLITESDRSLRNACMVLAARLLKIPTMTLVHGVITREYGYTPVLADRILCWGELQKELLVELGTSPDRVVPVGFPRELNLNGFYRASERTRLGLPPDARVALLATNPTRMAWRLQLVEVFATAFQPRCGISPIVRLHPAEEKVHYLPVIRRFPHVRFLSGDTWPVEAALATADVVVCHNSGFSVETLLAQKPLILLDVIPLDLGANRDLTNTLGFPVAHDADELRRLTEHELQAPSGAARSYPDLSRFFAATGSDATERIIRQILELAVDLGTAT